RKVKVFDILDLASIAFLIGQGIGRWGNFMNQEAFGGPTGSSFFGMTSENVVRVFKSLGYADTDLAHPCFLYESIWCIGGAVLLHFLSKKRSFSGEVGLYYCVWYGFGRGFNELLRTDSLMIGSVKVSSLLSFIVCVAAAALLITIKNRKKIKAAETTYVDMFKDELAAEELFADEEDVIEEIDYDMDYDEVEDNCEENENGENN
ncbi:MAG: prolipoprotein diacylglyceryl transferase, partial [Clostridia bacterium]|nr:prolipoprotein diacylglyceryl transferase [Clostridia bacterium]